MSDDSERVAQEYAAMQRKVSITAALQAFLKSDAGGEMLAYIDGDRQVGVAAMAKANPADAKEVMAAQLEYLIPDRVITYIDSVIAEGVQAQAQMQQLFEQTEQPDNAD